MTAPDLVGLLALLGGSLALGVALVAFLVALARRRRRTARRIVGAAALLLATYTVALLLAALRSTDTVLARDERRCFDDWCVAVAAVRRVAAPGAPSGDSGWVIVTLRVSSRAGRIAQRPDEPRFWIEDARGRRYAPSPAGQAAWTLAHGPARAVDDRIGPGESFTTPLVFALPAGADRPALVVAEGPSWLGRIVIGGEDSPFHGRTKVPLWEP